MKEYDLSNVSIVCGENDMMLLFSSDYQRVCKKALNEAINRHKEDQTEKINLKAWKSCIEVFTKSWHETVFLESYNPKQDQKYSFGI